MGLHPSLSAFAMYSEIPTDIRAPRRLQVSQLLTWKWLRGLTLVGCDGTALAIAWSMAARLNQFYMPLPPQLSWGYWLGLPGVFWMFAGVTLLLFAVNGLYSAPEQRRNYVQAGRLVSLVHLLSLVVSYFYDPKLDLPRSLFLAAWLGSVVLVIAFRLGTIAVLRWAEARQAVPVPVYVIAPAEELPRLSQALKRRSRYRLAGAALASLASRPATLKDIYLSGAQEVLAAGLPQTELASSLYWQLRRAGITLRLVPSSLEMLHRRGQPEVIAGLPTLRLEAPLLHGWDYCCKRGLDFVAAGVGLVVLSPVWVGVAIAIKLSSPGPVLFRQQRVGLHGRMFRMWKFRTMVADAAQQQAQLEAANESDGVLFKLKADPRVTPLGRFLRRTSLDELPQLVNVLLGQMSLVGPRPLPVRDVERFDPWHHTRHQVLPGITGLWQISGRSQIETFNDAARLDLYYIDNWSLNLDLEILLETIKIVLRREGAY
jgi:exopolysaccharide biosynthesis polyprenyl glycosylphosphotransferase